MSECYVNKVYVSGESLKDFEDFVSTGNKEFSFNKVVPMPQTLNFNIGIMAGLATSFYIWRQTGEGNLYMGKDKGRNRKCSKSSVYTNASIL